MKKAELFKTEISIQPTTTEFSVLTQTHLFSLYTADALKQHVWHRFYPTANQTATTGEMALVQ